MVRKSTAYKPGARKGRNGILTLKHQSATWEKEAESLKQEALRKSSALDEALSQNADLAKAVWR
jgi:hypothetical protein